MTRSMARLLAIVLILAAALAGAVVGQSLFVIDLPDLGGAAKLREAGVSVDSLVEFEGD